MALLTSVRARVSKRLAGNQLERAVDQVTANEERAVMATIETNPALVITVLREARIPMTPDELQAALRAKEAPATADEVQSVVWDLIGSGELHFTPDRRVTLAH